MSMRPKRLQIDEDRLGHAAIVHRHVAGEHGAADDVVGQPHHFVGDVERCAVRQACPSASACPLPPPPSTGANLATWRIWNIGAAVRRWKRQLAPSALSRPLPSAGSRQPLHLVALDVIGRIVEQDMLDAVRIVDEQEIADTRFQMNQRQAIRALAECRDRILPQFPQHAQE